jgi:hypothetical protein
LGNACPVYDPNRPAAGGNGQYNPDLLAPGSANAWVDGFPPAN